MNAEADEDLPAPDLNVSTWRPAQTRIGKTCSKTSFGFWWREMHVLRTFLHDGFFALRNIIVRPYCVSKFSRP